MIVRNFVLAIQFTLTLRYPQETQVEGESSHFTLFDTGPDSRAIARNLAALQVDTAQIERVILSHWHSDHSGGLLTFLRTRQESASASAAQPNACVVDLHPDRPIARGISSMGRVIGRLPNDPTFEEIRAGRRARDACGGARGVWRDGVGEWGDPAGY